MPTSRSGSGAGRLRGARANDFDRPLNATMTLVDSIVFGILRLPDGHLGLDLAARRWFMDLTVTWSRYGFSGPMIEGDTVEAILQEACEQGFEWCLVQQCGHVFVEKWVPANSTEHDFFAALYAWIERTDAPFTAASLPQGGLDSTLMLVNLSDYAAMGRPDLAALASLLEPGLLSAFPESLRVRSTRLLGESAAQAHAFRALAGPRIAAPPPAHPLSCFTAGQRAFLDGVAAQTQNSRRGVFLFNIEAYDDIAEPPDGFAGPVSTLYSVAAGFKPNRILETHGFTPATRVVYFDYSDSAFCIKREMLKFWNGYEFPLFMRHLFRRYPHPETFYQLWGDSSPTTVSWSDVETQWQRELTRWGGAQAFAESWARYRTLEHHFVPCSVLNSLPPLRRSLQPDYDAVIWWSNAFFTVYSNWFLSIEERQAAYERWIRAVAKANPGIWLYGSDSNNVSVNAVQAGPYVRDYFECPPDALTPRSLGRVAMRM